MTMSGAGAAGKDEDFGGDDPVFLQHAPGLDRGAWSRGQRRVRFDPRSRRGGRRDPGAAPPERAVREAPLLGVEPGGPDGGFLGEAPLLVCVEPERQPGVGGTVERGADRNRGGEARVHRLHDAEAGERIQRAGGVAHRDRPGFAVRRGADHVGRHVGGAQRGFPLHPGESLEDDLSQGVAEGRFGVSRLGGVEHHGDVAAAGDDRSAPHPPVGKRGDQGAVPRAGREVPRDRRRAISRELPAGPGQRPAASGGVHREGSLGGQVVTAPPTDRQPDAAGPDRRLHDRALHDADSGPARFVERPLVEPIPAHEALSLAAARLRLHRNPILPAAPSDDVVGWSGGVHRLRQLQPVGSEQSRRRGREALAEVLPPPAR